MKTRADNTTATALLLTMLAVLAVGWPGFARGQSIDENKAAQVKAGYLVNFLRFARWPEQAFDDEKAPLVIAVIEPDPLGRVLDAAVRSLEVAGRSVRVRRVTWPKRTDFGSDEQYDQARQRATAVLQRIHLLLLPAQQLDGDASDVLKAVANEPVMTVGEGQTYMSAGTMLALELDRHRIVFHANVKRVRESPINVSSRLLSLARIYEP